ncbi:MAG: hypothetical protein ACKVOQ_05195 [Cyclobacteriaceae bacterium]
MKIIWGHGHVGHRGHRAIRYKPAMHFEWSGRFINSISSSINLSGGSLSTAIPCPSVSTRLCELDNSELF